jgi:precorrin-6A/cobalt-precorrin-6A reductase
MPDSAKASIVVLGGTTEARQLADRLARDRRYDVCYSLAGVTRSPRLPEASYRIGGFGGVDGLATYIIANDIQAIVDATHPFAANMPRHAAMACQQCAIPYLRLLRPPWVPTDADDWHAITGLNEVAKVLPGRCQGPTRMLVTSGTRQLEMLAGITDATFFVRTVEPIALPSSRFSNLVARGPFTEAAELQLMLSHRIDWLLTKNSGGDSTRAKLDAARSLGVGVLILERPLAPVTTSFPNPDELLDQLHTMAF